MNGDEPATIHAKALHIWEISMPVQLRPITPGTIGFSELESESLRHGFRMLERLRQGWESDADHRFIRPGELLAGAFLDDALIGIGGRSVDPYAGDPRVGRVRHVYVLESQRGSGIGRLLIQNVIRGAGRHFSRLPLRAPPTAFGFYEHLGFVRIEGLATMTHHLPLQ
jgi:GNAT superfamily N-acetyltransferase